MTWMLGLAAVLALCDQAIKALVRRLPLYVCAFRIDGLMEITHVNNTGAAFSLMAGRTALLAVLSILLMAAVLLYVEKQIRPTKQARLAVAMLLGGALGNLIDRVRFGAVTDYIRVLFVDFPVFNFADILITAAVALLMLLALMNKLEEKGTAREQEGGR